MIVRTVLGDVDPNTLGATYLHEHLLLDSPLIARDFPHIHLPSVDDAVAEVNEAAAVGVGAMVDAMPCGGGRKPLGLAEVSHRTGVAVIAATGLHTERYYAEHPWALDIDVDALTAMFVADITIGIDRNDHLAEATDRTNVRAGIIKVATSGRRIDERAARLFAAAATAHEETGAPLLTHCEDGHGGIEQLELLATVGVEPQRVVLSHTDKVVDIDYHLELAERGVNLEYDQALRQSIDEAKGTAWLIGEMVEAGHAGQLMLGTDGARRSLWSTLGGAPGLSHLASGFATELRRRGIGDDVLDQMFVHNPRRFLTFDEKGAS